jgi:hypothetical protein
MYDGLKNDITYTISSTGCWECNSHARNSKGYPFFSRDGKFQKIARYIYEQKYGAIPEGMVIRHKCNNPKCINPDHLEIGTHKENKGDMVNRGRSLFGSTYP